uniref:class I SAM-dependent methyltransferase n=1 Tax=Polynucleobacter sp. TaxID=2029855 RepID=UPI0040489A18
MRINLGAGNDIRSGYVNHDMVGLEGIDVVHDLNSYPWPWPSNSATELVIRDVLEHLDELIPALEEVHRILIPGGVAHVKVPYWNGWSRHADPTHKRGFHELTFHFFDPNSVYCKDRHYYSSARFLIEDETFVLAPLSPYFSIPGIREVRITSYWGRRIVGLIGNSISNIILDLEVSLRKPLA